MGPLDHPSASLVTGDDTFCFPLFSRLLYMRPVFAVRDRWPRQGSLVTRIGAEVRGLSRSRRRSRSHHRSRVVASSFTSCTLAPLTASDSGTPRPSTNKLRLRPFFSPLRPIRSPPRQGQRGFHQGPVVALPVPGNALQIIVLSQSRPPQRRKETRPVPLLKMLVDGARAAEFLGQGLPLTSRAQHIHNGREDPARRHRPPPTPRLPSIFSAFRPLSNRNQRFDFHPKLLGYFPRFYLRHLGQNHASNCSRLQQLFTDKLFAWLTGN